MSVGIPVVDKFDAYDLFLAVVRETRNSPLNRMPTRLLGIRSLGPGRGRLWGMRTRSRGQG
jgi:hypothetical protein